MLQGLYRAMPLIQEQDPWKSMSSLVWSLQTKITHESLIWFWCQRQSLLWYPCQRLSSPCQVEVKSCVSVWPFWQHWRIVILVYLSSDYVVFFIAIWIAIPLWFQRHLIVNVFQDELLAIVIEFLRLWLWTNLGLLSLVACWGVNFMIILLSFKSVSDLFLLQPLQNAGQYKPHFLNGGCEQQNKSVVP